MVFLFYRDHQRYMAFMLFSSMKAIQPTVAITLVLLSLVADGSILVMDR